ncbi:uncharacterized protein HD556DRAFT_1476976 [Suillus plorans]|uniref:DUF6532 domain-containing protein n=1 Tax=Suillus plorans TaxID=116603 RepID=A0A9P7ARQ4_9AGAM|nr:uncharacterized protein HD556DRAFT_1476976 [Suillus plorans]KAG1793707.1 hypothetical protein HD556DRAFT_1476976 [Suillus plorans]
MTPPASPRRTRPKNATQRPGLILLEGQKKRRTKAQIAEDLQHAKDVQAVQAATAQRGISHIAGIEADMQAQQSTQASGRGKLPVKPRPRPVKSKKAEVVATNELTLESPIVPATQVKAKGTGKYGTMGRDADGVDAGDGEVIGNEVEKSKKTKKLKKANLISREVISAATKHIINQGKAPDKSTLHFMTLTWALSSRKLNVARKIDNWQTLVKPQEEVHSELQTTIKNPVLRAVQSASGNTLSVTTLKSSQTAATTVSSAKEPPPTLIKSSDGLVSEEDEEEDEEDEDEADEDEEELPEQLYGFTADRKDKAAMQSVVAISEFSDDEVAEAPAIIPFNLLPFTQQADIVRFALEQPRAPISTTSKRKIEDLVGYYSSSEEDIAPVVVDAELDLLSASEVEIEDVPKPMRTTGTAKTSVSVSVNPNPSKKAKVEPARQDLSKKVKTELVSQKKAKVDLPSKDTDILVPATPQPDLMFADMATKPKTIGQWRNTDLPSMMLEDGAWRRTFIPTVFLWAGAQPKFWTIETEQLLPALQSIFDVAYPGTNHNIQPKGPIIGLVNQRLCSWRSNFGSTAIALVTNFLAASKADEDDEDEDDTSDFEQVLATNLLEDYAFLYEDPETRDPDQIYRSIFMLEMIEAAHINAIAGFLDVPALNTHGLHLNGMQAVIAACAAALERAFSFAAKC